MVPTERTASLSPRYGASRLSLRPSFRALSSPAQVPDVNCASDVTHQFKSDSNTPGFGALIKCWSNVCKILPDCLTGTRLYQPARALRPLDRLIFHANALSVRLLFWLASNDTAYMVGATSSAYDPRLFMCIPFNGMPSDFERFERDFSTRLSREYLKDDDFSLLEAMEGTDEYGAVNQADPALALRLPSDPALTAAERRQATEMMRMHRRRNRVLASYVICHLLDENLRTMVKAAHPTDGYAAAQMVRAHCYREPNNITILQMNRTWADCDFSSVGIDEHTINNMIRFLYGLNTRRPAARRYTEDEIVEKMLSCFKPGISEALSHTAMVELATDIEHCRFIYPVAAGAGLPARRSLQALLEFMEPLWRLSFQQGGIRGGRRGHAADGALLATDEDDTAFLARANRRPPPRRPAPVPTSEIAQRNLPRCFRCQGIGHIASLCANPADTVVTLNDAMNILRVAQSRPPPPQRRPAANVPAGSASRQPARNGERERALFAGDDDDGADQADPVGEDEETAYLAQLDEVQILGEDDPYDDPFGDDTAFAVADN